MKIIIYFVFFTVSIFSQTEFIQQITHGDYDARNPFIYKHEYQAIMSKIYFEIHKNGYANIYSLGYNSINNQFEDTVAITKGNYLNINPSYEEDLGLIFQTNQNGNWDIAFIPFINNQMGEMILLTNSLEDETEPKYLKSFNHITDSLNILFRRNGAVIFLTYKDQIIKEDVVFKNDSQYLYTEFIGSYNYNVSELEFSVFAIEENKVTNKKSIVRKSKAENGEWLDKTVVVDNCDCSDIAMNVIGYGNYVLIYQDSTKDNRRLFYLDNPFSDSQRLNMPIDYEGNISEFDLYAFLIVTKRQAKLNNEQEFYFPHTYLVEQNNQTKIRLSHPDYDWSQKDSLHPISISDSKTAIGPLGGWFSDGFVVFTVWEDSANSNIHLFGAKEYFNVGSVANESYASDFSLLQNYPNPFNPKTKIEYKLLQAAEVKLNVTNILGEIVFEQNYGYQTAGSYKMDFDGKNLPSGVYIYSILTGENRLSRKMVLLK